MIKKRKKRCDRKHIVYRLSVNSKDYIGVTYVEKQSPRKSLKRRWQKHVRRALTENRDWKLCQAIRKYGPDAFIVEIISVVRGKAQAHNYERELIYKHNPKLNTDKRGIK